MCKDTKIAAAVSVLPEVMNLTEAVMLAVLSKTMWLGLDAAELWLRERQGRHIDCRRSGL